MNKCVKDTIVVVTGGAAGIGFAISDKFLENEAKMVIVLDIDKEAGKKAQKTLNVNYGVKKSIFMKCDVTKDLEDVYKNIIEKFEYVDVLVNNSGIANEDSIRKTVKINIVAVVEWSMKFLEHMRVDKGGRGGTIINLSSNAGFTICHLFPYYTASKFAVMGFTKTLGHNDNFKIYGVRVAAICPGFTETNIKVQCLDPKQLAAWNRYINSKVWQKAETVGQAAVQVYLQAESGTAWMISESKLEQIS